jgi:ADP-heptose:LPS heptosyltransferase
MEHRRERLASPRPGPRILIARRDHLGDVPTVAARRAALPDAHLSFLATAGPGEILSRCPDLDECGVLLDGPGARPTPGESAR